MLKCSFDKRSNDKRNLKDFSRSRCRLNLHKVLHVDDISELTRSLAVVPVALREVPRLRPLTRRIRLGGVGEIISTGKTRALIEIRSRCMHCILIRIILIALHRRQAVVVPLLIQWDDVDTVIVIVTRVEIAIVSIILHLRNNLIRRQVIVIFTLIGTFTAETAIELLVVIHIASFFLQ